MVCTFLRSRFSLARLSLCSGVVLFAGCGSADAERTGVTSSEVCASANLTADPSVMKGPAGTVVTWTAGSSCAPGDTPSYRFYMQPPGGPYAMVRDYTGDPTYVWNTAGLTPGAYNWQVWVRSSSGVLYERYRSGTFTVTPGTSCSSVSLASTPALPQFSGTDVTLTASAAGCLAPQYRYYMRGPGSPNWVIVQDYGSPAGANYSFRTTAGTYQFQVWAREAGSALGYEAYRSYAVAIQDRPACTAVTATASPAGPVEAGTTVELAPVATCVGTPEYKLLLRRPSDTGYVVVREYGSADGLSWFTGGEPAGTYELRLLVRNVGSSAESESSTDLTIAIEAPDTFNECNPENACLPALPPTTPPRVEFSGSWVSGNTYVLDASASVDDDTPFSGLRFRWDFNGDGTWDTAPSSSPIVTRAFVGTGAQQVSVQVSDSCGLTTTKTRLVQFGRVARTIAAGTYTSDSWDGLVVVTGPVTVNSLSIAAGTHVLFAYVPDAQGNGTAGLTVDTLALGGTADAPILMSVLGTEQRRAGAWRGLAVNNISTSGETIIEYADEGVTNPSHLIRNLHKLLVHHSHRGIRLGYEGQYSRWDNYYLSSVQLRHNTHEGLLIVSRMGDIFGLEASNNAGVGVVLDRPRGGGLTNTNGIVVTNNAGGGLLHRGSSDTGSGSVALNQFTAHNNRKFGLHMTGYQGSMPWMLTVTNNDVGILVTGCANISASKVKLQHNRQEGLVVANDSNCANQPQVSITSSALYCNANAAGAVVTNDLNVTATPQGATYALPGQELIDWVDVTQADPPGAGQLLAGGASMWTAPVSAGSYAVYTSPAAASSVTLQGASSLSLARAVHHSPTAARAQVLLLRRYVVPNPPTGYFQSDYWGLTTPVVYDAASGQYLTIQGTATDPTIMTF